MTELYAKDDIAARLRAIQTGLSDDVTAMTAEQFERSSGEEWSAAEYLKHLILGVKPFARAISLPSEALHKTFGTPDRPSMSYEELTAVYQQSLADGMRAESVPGMTPVDYRLPADMTDLKSTLLMAWHEGNDRLLATLASLDENALDTHQLPHPAIGVITLREMLYFTVYHNTMHWQDIRRVGQ